jgi:aryl-alcohol dehydrogenase-like predicted oxidoreductase
MEYVILGKTGRKVSRIGYGGTVAGLKNYTQGNFDPEEQQNKEQLIEAIQTAFTMGVNYFDTAPGYGNGVSERIFGEALDPFPREDLFLATKAGFQKPENVRPSLERSLKNLRRERIDLIQFHGTFYSDEAGEAILKKGGMLETLEKARDEGLVDHIGFTIECQNISLYRLIRSGRFDTMQIQYNLLFQHPCDAAWKTGGMYEAEEQNLGIITMRTLSSGIFQKWINTVNPANTFDYNPALLQFNLSNPLVDVALLGMHNADQVRANVAICEDTASRIDIFKLHDRYVH